MSWLITCKKEGESKIFWNYVRSKRKSTNDLVALKLENGHVITNDDEITDSTNKYFASVFTSENLNNIPSFDVIGGGAKVIEARKRRCQSN